MIIEDSIKVRDYKCFASEPQGFDKIYPINIIIGKNNSGKSSLVDLIEYLIHPTDEFLETGRGRIRGEVIVSHLFEEEEMKSITSNNSLYHDTLAPFFNKVIEYKIITKTSHPDGKLPGRISFSENYFSDRGVQETMEQRLKKTFHEKSFARINAERDIVPERASKDKVLSSNGKSATNIIRRYINEKGFDQDIIKKSFLQGVNQIISPDIYFKDILTRYDNEEWEVVFEDENGTWVTLSKMGSGVKTIILVLLNLLVIPKLDKKEYRNYVFAFEELENNLHPSLQRRLFNFIRKYSKDNDAYFFITTHSNIVIDLFGSYPLAQIIHVQKQGDRSIATSISPQKHNGILKDLDFKASDLLLSNGIIWVEGPSDAIYLELLLDLYNIKIGSSENGRFSYTIQSLSTAIWKYAGFSDFNWEDINVDLQSKIISLAKLNHNHLVIIDNDGNYEDKKPSEWESFANGTGKNKAKLIFETIKYGDVDETKLETNFGDINDNKVLFWINDGTFETYLEHFINNRGLEFHKYFDLTKSRGYFEKKREGDNSSISKVILASDVAKFCLKNNLTLDDIAPTSSGLLNKIERLYNTIKSWN